MFGAEEFFGAIAGQVFYDVGVFAAAIVPLAGVAFGVFIRENAADGFENGFRDKVLAGDEFEAAILPFGFVLNRLVDEGIDFGQRPVHKVAHSVIPFAPRS